MGASPGGQCGASLTSSAVDLPLHFDASNQLLPGPHDDATTDTPDPEAGSHHYRLTQGIG